MNRTTEKDYSNTACDSYSWGGGVGGRSALSEFHTLSEGSSRGLELSEITFFQVKMPGRVSVPRYSCCSAGLVLWLCQRCLSSSRMLLAENSSGISCQVFAQCTLELGTVWKWRAMVSSEDRQVMATAVTLSF